MRRKRCVDSVDVDPDEPDRGEEPFTLERFELQPSLALFKAMDADVYECSLPKPRRVVREWQDGEPKRPASRIVQERGLRVVRA